MQAWLDLLKVYQTLLAGSLAVIAAIITATAISRASRRTAEATAKATLASNAESSLNIQKQISHGLDMSEIAEINAERKIHFNIFLRRASLAAAFSGEIDAALNYYEAADYLGNFKSTADRLRNEGKAKAKVLSGSAMPNFSFVFNANASNVGELEPKILSSLCRYYALLNAIDTELRRAEEMSVQNFTQADIGGRIMGAYRALAQVLIDGKWLQVELQKIQTDAYDAIGKLEEELKAYGEIDDSTII